MTHGIIILEGPDGAGKTYLADKLRERYHKDTGQEACYIHGRAWKDVWRWHLGMLRRAAHEAERRLVIVDRHWISECIYGTVLRSGPGYSVAGQRALHRQWLHLGALYVLCVPDPEFIVSQHAALTLGREELVKKTQHMRDVACRYVDLVKGNVLRDPQGDLVEQLANAGGVNGHANWYHYDRERERAMSPQLPRILLDLARKRHEARRYPGRSWGLVTGSPTATVALVGDRSNAATPQPPFLADVHSSRYLGERLHARRIPEGLIALINANDVVSDDELRHMLKPYRRVVALGGKAADRLITAGHRADIAIRHPQYARRFQHHGDYARELDDAIFGGASSRPG